MKRKCLNVVFLGLLASGGSAIASHHAETSILVNGDNVHLNYPGGNVSIQIEDGNTTVNSSHNSRVGKRSPAYEAHQLRMMRASSLSSPDYNALQDQENYLASDSDDFFGDDPFFKDDPEEVVDRNPSNDQVTLPGGVVMDFNNGIPSLSSDNKFINRAIDKEITNQ